MNPLLSREYQIPFHEIQAEHVVPAVRQALAGAESELAELARPVAQRTYADTIQRLDDLIERLSRVIDPVSHLVSVMSSDDMRAAFNAVLPEFSAFFARLPLNEELWSAVREFSETPEAQALTGVRRRHLEKIVRDFQRAGANLPAEQKAEVQQIQVRLSQLHTTFAENALDATNAFHLQLTGEEDLAGLPETAITRARADAAAHDLQGWRFTLQAPSYLPFMQYSERRELRQQMYEAYVGRAAEPPYDNRGLISEILGLRQRLAEILGYRNFADYQLEENMAGSGARALSFLEDLTERTRPLWENEIEALEEHAERMGAPELAPWDIAFIAEHLRQQRFEFSEEELRPFFPLDRVLAGMFGIAERIFGVKVTERPVREVWHPDVQFYEVTDEDGTRLGAFYADWFPRESKRAGAWMDAFITGGPLEGSFSPHLGLIVANFSPPDGDHPALLTHNEVETTFHEFGHLLHHLTSRVEVPARAGTNVPRDWVELPSQIMENWTWEREALDLFARHHETGEPIPEGLYEKMVAARTFMAASHQMRQLSLGVVDLNLHINYDPERDGDAIAYAQEIISRYTIRPEFARNHFLATFSHVFTGGYAAGYYSYLWSEVLDADAFTRFQREGIFNRETGRAYVDAILSRGDSADADDLFREFMGRDPDLNPLLRRNLGAGVPAPGISDAQVA